MCRSSTGDACGDLPPADGSCRRGRSHPESRSREGGRARAVLPWSHEVASLPAVRRRHLLALALAVPTVAGLVADERSRRPLADRPARGADCAAARRPPLLAARRLRSHRRRVARDPACGRRYVRSGRARRDVHARRALRAAGRAPRRRCGAAVPGRSGQRPLERPASRRGRDPDDRRARGGVDPRRQPAHAARVLPRARGAGGAARARARGERAARGGRGAGADRARAARRDRAQRERDGRPGGRAARGVRRATRPGARGARRDRGDRAARRSPSCAACSASSGDDGAADRRRSPGSRDSTRSSTRCARPASQVELALEGEPSDVPAGVELSAYRIVQEALTNTLRHAFARRACGGRRATARRELEVEVARRRRRPAAHGRARTGAAWSVCASAWRCSAASSRRARGPAAASASRATPFEPHVTIRVLLARRPGARPQRLPDDPRRAARDRGRRRGRGRAAGDRPREPARSRT